MGNGRGHQWVVTNHADVHCELAVDGVVIDSNSGPKDALCALRQW